jgi:hypothetical protein
MAAFAQRVTVVSFDSRTGPARAAGCAGWPDGGAFACAGAPAASETIEAIEASAAGATVLDLNL